MQVFGLVTYSVQCVLCNAGADCAVQWLLHVVPCSCMSSAAVGRGAGNGEQLLLVLLLPLPYRIVQIKVPFVHLN